MGTCKFCGEKAGLFSSSHKNCATSYLNGKSAIVNKIANAISNKTEFPDFDKEVQQLAITTFIKKEELPELYSLGFDKSVEAYLEDGILSTEEEQKITAFLGYFNFDQNIIDKRGSLQKVAKASILRDVLEGKIPESRLNLQGNLPFLLQKGETLIWVFQDVEFYEQKTITSYEGRSQGVSVRIAKGLYYRTGGFKGNPVKSEETVLQGKGILALTNKQLYYTSPGKTFKTPYAKIISLNQYSDGLGLQKDGVSAKPQILKGLDGWFTYNLISNLSQM